MIALRVKTGERDWSRQRVIGVAAAHLCCHGYTGSPEGPTLAHRYLKTETAALAQTPTERRRLPVTSVLHEPAAAAVVRGLGAVLHVFEINNNPDSRGLWVKANKQTLVTSSSAYAAPSPSIIPRETPTPGQQDSTCSCYTVAGCYFVTPSSICLPSHLQSEQPPLPSYLNLHLRRRRRPRAWQRWLCWSRPSIKWYFSAKLIMQTCTCQAQYPPGDKKIAGCTSTCLFRLYRLEVCCSGSACKTVEGYTENHLFWHDANCPYRSPDYQGSPILEDALGCQSPSLFSRK